MHSFKTIASALTEAGLVGYAPPASNSNVQRVAPLVEDGPGVRTVSLMFIVPLEALEFGGLADVVLLGVFTDDVTGFSYPYGSCRGGFFTCDAHGLDLHRDAVDLGLRLGASAYRLSPSAA